MDLVAAFEQATGGLMPQIMETQILNSQQVTGSRECGADALGVIRKNPLARLELSGDKRPGLGRIFESPMIPVLASRVLGVPDQAGACGLIVVAPFESADFRLPTRRSRPLKCSRSRTSSSAVGRRVRFLGLPIGRSSPQAERACWTISGLTGSSRTLLAALRTTPIQIRSLITVAGPAPSARRDCTCRIRSADVRVSALVLPSACRSRNSR